MKLLTTACLAAATLMASSLSSSSAFAGEDGKNYGGMLCRVISGSAGSVYYDTWGRVCNNSSSSPLQVICPLTKDSINTKKFEAVADYNLWNSNKAVKCQSFSRSRYGYGHYWSGWKIGDDYGPSAEGLHMTTNSTVANGFIGVRCEIPQKTSSSGGRSCLATLCVDEQT